MKSLSEVALYCGVPILPCGVLTCQHHASTLEIPLGPRGGAHNTSHVKIPRGFFALFPLIVHVFMQINKAFYICLAFWTKSNQLRTDFEADHAPLKCLRLQNNEKQNN